MAFDFSNLEQYSLGYAFAKVFPTFVHNYIFYNKVYTQGLENIPEDGAVIFAPNHQNALMDALIILSVKNWQPVFMARADIFAGQLMRRFLFFCKILPIFRMRDGKESLKENDAVFNKAVDVLRNRRYLVIYPEASHKGIRKLRPLKKGITRIAFMAEEASNYTLNVKIVPVGINYQDYYSFRTNAFINFGKPISVLDYKQLYEENPQKANHDLVLHVQEELSKLIIDIQDNENYDNFEIAREIYAPFIVRKEGKLVNNFKNRIIAGKKVVEIMDNLKESNPEKFQILNETLKQYREILSSENLRDWIIRKRFKLGGALVRTLALILTSPLALYGFLNNCVPYHTPFLITRKIKDRNFHTSIRFALYLILFPISYACTFAGICHVFEPWWIRILYMIMVPFTGLFSHTYYDHVKRIFSVWKVVLNKRKPTFLKLRILRDKIVDIFKSI